jgi:flagellar hook-associated protein 3 FlgL
MRIADKMQFDQVRDNLSKNRSQMSQLQSQAATQKRVTKPSDDPVASARVLMNRAEVDGNVQYEKNLKYAQGFLEFTDQSLGELTENLIRAKELAIGQANDASANQTSRRVTAAEVGQIYEALVQIGNRKLGDRHIFGGFVTTRSPFELSGQYTGDDGEMMIHVDKGSFVPMNIPGSKIFLGEGISADGRAKPTFKQATSLAELAEQRRAESASEARDMPGDAPAVALRQPAAEGPGLDTGPSAEVTAPPSTETSSGINLFKVLKRLEVALMTNDKSAVQESIVEIDDAIAQVVITRSQAGARVMALNNAADTLAKGTVEVQSQISQLEDADIYKVVSDINQTESTLKATLAASGKMVQPSLMDFLR